MPRARPLPSTCAVAYQQIQERGLLSRMRFKAYEIVAQHGPLTQRQVDVHFGSDSGHKRISELVERGVVRSVGEGTCPISGMQALLWDLTDQMPVEPATPAAPALTGRAKAIREIREAIPERRRSPELQALLEELEYQEAPPEADFMSLMEELG